MARMTARFSANRAGDDQSGHGEANPLVVDPTERAKLGEKPFDDGPFAAEVCLKR